jgi:peptidoglycan/LPS O-acetylase OafA/YrhL
VTNKKIYFENLDGLRFLCFLLVFIYHTFHNQAELFESSQVFHFLKKDIFGNGNLGVNFFFVLSGFLITFLLMEEKKMNSTINIRNFYIRRILRIWPLYFICVAFGFFVYQHLVTLVGQDFTRKANIYYYLLFISNFDFIQSGAPNASMLGVLWSVAIEEQFYLVWPLILSLFPVKQWWIPFSVLIAVSLGFRILYDNPVMHEIHTLSCIGDMTIGAFGAWMMQNKRFKSFIEQLPKWQIGILYLLFLLIFFFRHELLYSIEIVRYFERSIVALVILFIILEQTYSVHSFYKMSSFKRISRLGIITYGLYCLHLISLSATVVILNKLHLNEQVWQAIFIKTPLSLALTIIAAHFSYKYFESPFLRLKDRFAFITK